MVIDPVSIAIQLALVVASIILTARNIEVGKLDDTNVDTGSYNRIIPRVYGTQMVVPQTIWIANNKLVEVKKKKKILAGLGGSVTTYHYFATFAVAITNNKVQVRRIWANDQLVFDISDTTNGGFSDETVREVLDNGKGRKLFYEYRDGSDDQPISSIVSGVDGAAETSAYRGISYMVIENFPLKNAGNSIPQFKFEVVEVEDTATTTLPLTFPSGVDGVISVDTYERIIAPGFGRDVQIIDPTTNQVQSIVQKLGQDFDFPFDGSLHYVDQYNVIVGPAGGGDGMAVMDATTGVELGVGTDGGNSVHRSNAVFGDHFWRVTASGVILNSRVESWSILSAMANGSVGRQHAFTLKNQLGIGANLIEFPIVAPSGPNTVAVSCRIAGDQAIIFIRDIGADTIISLEDEYGFNGRPGIGYSLSEDAYIFAGNAGVYKVDRLGTLLGSLNIPLRDNVIGLRALTQHDYPTIWLTTLAQTSVQINLSTMTVLREIDISDNVHDVISLGGSTAFVVDTNSQSVDDWKTVFYDRVEQAGTTVRHIVEDLADQIGFAPSRLDASAGTRDIGGMIVAGDDARRSIDELLKITGYDLIEEDGKIKLIDRGNAPVMAIDADDLGTDARGGKPYRLERTLTREADAPWKVELGFSDIDGEFESNLAIARRAIDAVETQTVLSVDTPIALDVDTAKTFAGKMLSQSHREREGVSLSLPMVKYGRLSPGDVISVPDGADTLNVKIVRASGAHVLEIKGVIDDPTGIDTLLIGTPRNVPSPTLARLGVPSVIMVDSALPYDTADAQDGYGLSSNSILPGRSIGSVDLFRSDDDGVTYEFIDSTPGEPMVASTGAALVDIAHPNVLDQASSLTVTLADAPSSATQQELLDDATRNIAFVSAGEGWEVVQYMTVTENGGDSYTLSGFYRGLRGTEHLIGAHTPSDQIVLHDGAYLRGGDFTHYQSDLKLIAMRTENDDPIVIDATPQMHGLRPYSPVDLSVVSTAGDALIEWTRRTRIGGSDLNGSDVPLSEASEQYEIDILDGTLSVVATKTGITSPSYTYSAAEQSTDLGGDYQPFTAHVYQISAEIGRGEPTELYFTNPNLGANTLVFQTFFPTSTSVVDNSENAHNITLRSGSSVTDTTTEFGGLLASIQTSASTGGFTVANHPDFNFGGGPWTFEIIANHTNISNYDDYLVKYGSGNFELILRYQTGVLEILSSSNGTSLSGVVSSPVTIINGQDHHIVFQGDGNGNASMYFDGTRVFDGPLGSYPLYPGTEDVNIGYFSSSNDWDGYIKWVAVHKQAKYSGAVISVPTGVY